MTSIYAIQAGVSVNEGVAQTKYFKEIVTYPITEAGSVKTEFVESAADATYFKDYLHALGFMKAFIRNSIKSSLGKTMFEAPLSLLVGGDHERRSVTIELQLMELVGPTLSGGYIVTRASEVLQGEEYSNGHPYVVVLVKNLVKKMQIRQQFYSTLVGGFKINPVNTVDDKYVDPTIPEYKLTPFQLEQKYLNKNGGFHPVHTRDKWKECVKGDFTDQGYWDWVVYQYATAGA